jgi:hypothetical protein
MTKDVLVDMLERVRRYASRIERSRIPPRVRWNPQLPG